MNDREVDRIRDCIWETLIQPVLDRGESRACFDWEATVKAARSVTTNRANIQGAMEGWVDRRIKVRWFGERHWRLKTIVYVVDVEQNAR